MKEWIVKYWAKHTKPNMQLKDHMHNKQPG